MRGTIIALDYSDPAEPTPHWFVPTPNVGRARLKVMNYIADQVDRVPWEIDTVVLEKEAEPREDVPVLEIDEEHDE